MIKQKDGTYLSSDGEKWISCTICGDLDMEINMFKCETCGKIVCDDCYFSNGECKECFNK